MIKKFKTGHIQHVLDTLNEMLEDVGNKPVHLDGRSRRPPHGCVLAGMSIQGDILRLPLFGNVDESLSLTHLIQFLEDNRDKIHYVKHYDNRNKGSFHVSRIDDYGNYYIIL